ncbi:MAG: hypothetical protein WAN50_02010 [Minisyncoccia bacterium]
MTIAEAREICKNFIAAHAPAGGNLSRDAIVVGILILSSSSSFALGYFAGKDGREAGTVTVQESLLAETGTAATSSPQSGQFVASKSGAKYYLSSCAGASRISDENKVWFNSAAAAKSAGYSPASNCKGL